MTRYIKNLTIALDAEGNNLKEMQSFVNLMPGEVTGCVGCHEQRIRAPHKMPSLTLQALDRSPSRIQPLDEAPESGILHFPRDIQPILGKHCAGCHNWNKPSGGIVLSDDIGLGVHHSIHSLARKELLTKRRRNFLSKFTGGHHDVEASPEELRWLRNWFFTHGQYSGTYGSLGTRTGGTGMPWAHPTNKDHAPLMPNLSIDTAVLESRCDSCHLGGKERKYRGGHAGATWPFGIYHSDYFNLSNPEKSLILLAPLAREAGGLGLCRNRKPDKRPKDMVTEGDPHVIFQDRQDPDYKALLAQVRSLAAQARRKRVFPVENWRPVPDILREMKRYGALPESFDILKDPVDPFELDEAYYRLFYPGGRRFRQEKP